MKPELLPVLNGIGYQKALMLDRSLAFLMFEPGQRPGLYKDKTEAKEAHNALEGLRAALLNLPDHALELLEGSSKYSEDWDSGRSPLQNVADGLGRLLEYSEDERARDWSGRGPSRSLVADETARWLAKIFVLGLGEMPSAGESQGEPSGRFTKAVADVFKLASFKERPREPAHRAVAWLKANNQEEFSKLIKVRETGGNIVSLLTVNNSPKMDK